MVSLWVASMGSALLLLWRHIPTALSRTNDRARNLMTESTRVEDAYTSRLLLKKALALAADRALEDEIASHMNQGTILEPPENHDAETQINAEPASSLRSSQPVVSPAQRYRLETELGKGAMGVVYKAWDQVLDRQVALKQLSVVFSGDEEYASRFRREAKALARLVHPNIVQVYDLIEGQGQLWMALEFVDGGDLATHLKNAERLSVAEAIRIAIPVAAGLACAHARGIVHRDLKPANILLTTQLIPKITDFGIAKLTQASGLTEVGSVLGSPPYMSPEQCSGGEVDFSTDIYALGITLYELLAGKVPFDGDTSSVLARHIVETPAPLSGVRDDIPDDLEKLILRLLAKKPDDRPKDMTAVIDLLTPFGEEVTAAKPL
jgi:serine/threonine-protein kinase